MTVQSPVLITDSAHLQRFCAALKHEEYLAVDTEFLRERTYYAELCLIQIAGQKHAAAVDVLAEGIDLTPLWELLNDPDVLKVFHAGKQDIEILLQITGKVPAPFFDTQVAAMLTGYGEQIGYEGLVRQLTKRELNKAQQYTDWSQRPLSAAQLEYALGDVIYLREIYEILHDKLDQRGRVEWVEEEMIAQESPARYQADSESAWLKIRRRDNKPHYLARMRALAAWREETAKAKNLPRGWVLTDDTVQELALYHPKSAASVASRLKEAKKRISIDAEIIHQLISEASELPIEECPTLAAVKPLHQSMEPARDLLKVLLRTIAQEQQIAASLIASTDDLTDIVQGERAMPAFEGWRGELFGKQAERLLAGEISLSVVREKHSYRVVLSHTK